MMPADHEEAAPSVDAERRGRVLTPRAGPSIARIDPDGEPPAEPGTYVLHLEVPTERRVRVGHLGAVRFAAGVYSYVGSARGPGGLAARLGRHLTGVGTRHWHIDHLRRVARPLEVWYVTGSAVREHRWASALARTPGVSVAVSGFGSSDCACRTHLFQAGAVPEPMTFAAALSEIRPFPPGACEAP